ncbi:Os09g0505050 [Oryza sativa Japonica Group]|uniref:Os09g0505050 protein n=1 Tax=Oryza sativa subsp. japonica TaxID=39947 RepID=A0A0P0XP15_ORYSJ|nr:Os09g0505050 [Oryza sativa Japonica Group]
MNAAALPRAMHTQHRPPTPAAAPAKPLFVPASAAAAWSSATRLRLASPAAAVVHCRSACSSSAISDTLPPRAPPAAAVLVDVAGRCPSRTPVGGWSWPSSSSTPRMTSSSVRRRPAATTTASGSGRGWRRPPCPPPSSSSSSLSRSLRRSRRLDDAAICSASVTPRRVRVGGGIARASILSSLTWRRRRRSRSLRLFGHSFTRRA